MRAMKRSVRYAAVAGLALAATLALTLTWVPAPLLAQGGATVFEGARLIDGRGGPAVENAAFVVEGSRITQVGRTGQIKAPNGAARVSLTGKTVMPAIVDSHVHMATMRDALATQLQGKAFYGVAAVMSLGQDTGDVAFQVRDTPIPGA